MAYAHFDGGATIKHSWGRFRAAAGEALTVGELVDVDFKAANATAGENPAKYVACEDIASGATGWFCLKAILEATDTIATGGVATAGTHGGTAGDILFLSTTAGDAAEAPATGILQVVGQVLTTGTVLLDPSPEFWEDCEIVTGNKTLDSEDSGKLMATVTDAVVFTLPAVATGNFFTIMNAGQDADALISVQPNSVDKISAPDNAGTDNKPYKNTKTTARCGDLMALAYKDAAGWQVTAQRGTWTEDTT